MSRAEKKGEADLQKNRRLIPLLVVALGGLATAVWALVLGWLALRLF
jgi:hypothetical protein